MKRVSNRAIVSLLILGVWVLPMLGALFARAADSNPSQRPYTITLDFRSAPGQPDQAVGQAPPNTELALYLNDRLLSVTNSNRQGDYSFDLPVLPQRRNDLVTLPTALDSTSLPLLYDVRGFQGIHIPPADVQITEPFLAAVVPNPQGIQLYGSVTPFTQVQVWADSCQNGAATPVNVDEEGGFAAKLLLAAVSALPAQYCFRVAPSQNPSAGKEFQIAAPAPSQAGSGGIWQRSIQLKFTPTDISLIFSVEMPERTLVYQHLARGDMSERQFIQYVFGNVTLNTFLDPRKLAWWQEKKPNSDRVTVFVESQPLTFLIPEDTETVFQLSTQSFGLTSVPPYGSADTVTAALDGVHILGNDPIATSGDASTQTWRGTLAASDKLTLHVSRSAAPPADPIGRTRLREEISKIMTNLAVVPPPLLQDTLEGQIIGLLPARLPAAEEAAVFDYFSSLYKADPFTEKTAAPQTFQSFLRDWPSRLPNWLGSLLFGMMWLIPAALTLWAVRDNTSPTTTSVRSQLAWIAAGVIVLTLLGLDWSSVLVQLTPQQRVQLAQMGIGRATFLNWILAGHAAFLVFYFPLPRWTRWLSARPWALLALSIFSAFAFTILARLALMFIPDGWLSVLLTGLPLAGFSVLAWQAGQIGKQEKAQPPSLGVTLFILAVIFLVSLPAQSLPLATRLGGIGVTTQGVSLARPLVPLALLIAVVVALHSVFDHPLGTPLKPLEREFGRVLMIGFAIGVTPAWGFVPLSIVTGLLLFEWVLPGKLLAPAQALADYVKNHHEEGVKQMLELNRRSRIWRTYMAGAQKQARENKLDDAAYQQKHAEYEQEKHSLERPSYLGTDQLTLHDLAFNFGAGPRLRDNLNQSLAWGVILAAPFTVLQGIPLALSELNTAGPFPFLSTSVRLVALVAQYMAAAAFLGYFFPFLRGRSGLEKGGWFAGSIILAFLPYHLIHDSAAIEWMVTAIWAASILAANLIVSLMAIDVHTLLHFHFSWFHLHDLYDLAAIDILQHANLARDEQIVAVPTLIKRLPAPLRRLVGDMSDLNKVLFGLDLRAQES